jgi:hypothetical protein
MRVVEHEPITPKLYSNNSTGDMQKDSILDTTLEKEQTFDTLSRSRLGRFA